MDNYTLIQNAARKQAESGRSGFNSLSRVDQADRWAAWQASADAPREAGARDTYFADESPAFMNAGADAIVYDGGSEAAPKPQSAENGKPGNTGGRRFAADAFVETPRARCDGGSCAVDRDDPADIRRAEALPEPEKKRSFALYNDIVARHRKVFGPEI